MAPRDHHGPRIGLFGMYASANLGDTCIQTEVVRALRARRPDCRFIAICNDPADAVATYGFDAVRISGYLPALRGDGAPWQAVQQPWPAAMTRGEGSRRILAVVRSLDLLLMSGGGQIEDFFGGTAAQPRYLLTWTLMARMAGVPVVYFSVGVDQLRARWSQRLAAAALTAASERSFRDAGSLQIARAAGMRGGASIVPDPALAFRPGTGDGRSDRRFIAVSPVSHRTWQVAGDAAYDRYLDVLSQACREWIAQGAAIKFVCSERDMDPHAVVAVRERLGEAARLHATAIEAKAPDAFSAAVDGADFLVTSRMHGAILGMVAGTPVLAISPARKLDQLMRDAGQSEHCVALRGLELSALMARASGLHQRRDAVRQEIRLFLERSRGELERAYDGLAARLSGVARPG